MKKKIWLIIVTAFAALMCGACLCGCGLFGGKKPDDNNKPDDDGKEKPVVVQNIYYSLNDDGQSYYAQSVGNVNATSYTVVSEVEGLPVTKVGDWLFSVCENLKTVIIQEGIREIGEKVFRDCRSLETLVIPSSVTTFGENAFGVGNYNEDAPKPATLTAPVDVLPIICTNNLETLVINGGETVSNRSTVSGTGLYSATKLKSVEIRNGVTAIGERAFSSCTALKSVSIPDSVKTIGDNAFGTCENLEYTEKGGAKYLGNTANPYLVLAGVDDKEITSFDFEDGTKILYGAFNGCDKLAEIELPSDLTCIGERAFYGCKKLASVEIPNTVATIGTYAFGYCKNLAELEIPSTVTNISKYAFLSDNAIVAYCEATEKPNGWDDNWNNRINERHADDYCRVVWNCETNQADDEGYVYGMIDGLRYKFKDGEASVAYQPIYLRCEDVDEDFDGDITIPEKVTYNDEEYDVTEIGKRAFLECENVTVVFIEEGVKQIAYRAFESCNSLTRVNIPSSVERIVDKAFYDCNSLTRVEIPLSVTEIGEYAFYNTNGMTIYCRASAKPDGWHSTWYKSVYVYNKTSAVWNCAENDKDRDGYAYTEVNSVRYRLKNGTATVIGQSRNITSAAILSTVNYNSDSYSVTTIDERAFSGCDKLTSVFIPYSVTSIGAGIFAGCNSLTTISVDGTNDKFMSSGNCLINKTTGTLLAGCKTSVIPSDGSVLAIGGSAFAGMDITEVAIPDSVTAIGGSAFSGCLGLTSVVIPDSVTAIYGYAFYGCTNLTSVKLSNTLESLGYGAFLQCYGLTSIRLPASLAEMEQRIFGDCKGLLDIYYDGTKAQWNERDWTYKWDWDMGDYTIHCTDGDISGSDD